MFAVRLKDFGFRTSVLLPSLMTGAVILCLSLWLYANHSNTEQTYRQERDQRVTNLQAATTFGLNIWQARVGLATTWSNPRNIELIDRTKNQFNALVSMSESYVPTTTEEKAIKRLVTDYARQAEVMFDYFYTLDDAVKHGITGSGKEFDSYSLHITSASYSQEWVSQATKAMNQIASVRLNYNGFVAGMRESYLANAIKRIHSAISILETNRQDAATGRVLKAAIRYQEALMMLDRDLPAYRQAHTTSLELGQSFNRELDVLQNQLGAAGFEFADELLASNSTTNNLTIGALLSASALAVLLSMLVVHNLHAQLQLPIRAAQAISDKDLSPKPVDDGNNEMGELSRLIDNMRMNIHAIVEQIVESSTQLSSASEEVSAISVQSSVSMRSQQDQLNSLTVAMDEMRATSADIASNAENSAHETNGAAESAKEGRDAIHVSVNAIRSVEEEMYVTTDTVHKLVEESQRIGSIVDVINSIADQTNLLALNAAIEAARAGEQGRGFAVVADEVRSLATRTQQSTGEIGSIIARLQEQATAAEKTMSSSVEKMGEGVDAVNRTGELIGDMNRVMTTIFDMSTQIASATEQQTAVSEELGNNMGHITQAANEVTEGAEQTTRACEELSSLAGELQVITAQFKL
ncbi:methyl-accepting chemotaxis protein [Photobacterium japonica]|uniref:methyl-accepting chemotaxis protein n=1 Tax=Photobacterium japonica TaxID=2910235 RepID=UPI003D107484